MALSVRDVRLLDGEYFQQKGSFRALFGLNFVKGLGAPPTGQVLVTHQREVLEQQLESLLHALNEQRDLIGYSYVYRFDGKPERSGGGAVAGFKVQGRLGSVSVRPSGYCYVRLSELTPAGRSRVVETIDLRVTRRLQTDDWGLLTVARRRADIGWFDELPPLIEWLRTQRGRDVEVLHL
jgi:hypothetical protein